MTPASVTISAHAQHSNATKRAFWSADPPEPSLRERQAFLKGPRIELYSLARVKSLLLRPAEAHEPSESSFATKLETARAAYLNLQLVDSQRFYQEALELMLNDVVAAPDPNAVASVLFELAALHFARKNTELALSCFRQIRAMELAFEPDAARYGPPIRRAWDLSGKNVGSLQPVTFELAFAPDDSRVSVTGGHVTGNRIEVPGPGRYLVTIRRLGYIPQSFWLDASAHMRPNPVVLQRASQGQVRRQLAYELEHLEPGAFGKPASLLTRELGRFLGVQHSVVRLQTPHSKQWQLVRLDGQIVASSVPNVDQSASLALARALRQPSTKTVEEGPWYTRWYVLGSAAAVVASVTVGVLISQSNRAEDQVLTVRGPR